MTGSIAGSFAISSDNDIPSGLFMVELLGAVVLVVAALAFTIEKLF